MSIKSIERVYRGESFYYTVGSYATTDRGDGIETIKIKEIIEEENKYILIDENDKKIFHVTKTLDIVVRT